jgi:hypothetical protein
MSEIEKAVAKALRSVRSVDGAVGADDIAQDARVLVWLAAEAGRSISVAEAVDMAVAKARAPQVGTGLDRIGAHASYLSQQVERDGDVVSFGSTLVAPDLILNGDDESLTLVERAAEGGADATLLAARRIVEGTAAHGSLAMRRGAVNTLVGADHDVLLAEGLDAVGGFHYGYGAKLLRWLDARGVAMSANTLYQWADRYKRRVVRENHSSRD